MKKIKQKLGVIATALLLLLTPAFALTEANTNTAPFGESMQPEVIPINDGSTTARPVQGTVPNTVIGGSGGSSKCIKYGWETVRGAITPVCLEHSQKPNFWDLHNFLRA